MSTRNCAPARWNRNNQERWPGRTFREARVIESLHFAGETRTVLPRSQVLACLSATRPAPGRLLRDTHFDQIVRYRARFVRGFFYVETNDGYWNS